MKLPTSLGGMGTKHGVAAEAEEGGGSRAVSQCVGTAWTQAAQDRTVWRSKI